MVFFMLVSSWLLLWLLAVSLMVCLLYCICCLWFLCTGMHQGILFPDACKKTTQFQKGEVSISGTVETKDGNLRNCYRGSRIPQPWLSFRCCAAKSLISVWDQRYEITAFACPGFFVVSRAEGLLPCPHHRKFTWWPTGDAHSAGSNDDNDNCPQK